MTREVISSEKAPKAVGPYSQGIKANGFVFCSGQGPINPETGELLTGSITEQTQQVLSNLKAVLEQAGSGMDKVVKVSVFLRDMNDFSEMNAEYANWFGSEPPARSTIQAARLPLDIGIEIDVIAIV